MLINFTKKILPITIIVASTVLFDTLAKAENTIESIAKIPLSKTLIAQNEYYPCGKLTVFVFVRSTKFYVFVCGKNKPSVVEILKIFTTDMSIMRLPLKIYVHNRVVAVNGNTRYTVTPSYLTVTQKGRVILKDKIIDWVDDPELIRHMP